MMRCVFEDIPGIRFRRLFGFWGPGSCWGFRAGRTGKLAFHVFQVLVCVTDKEDEGNSEEVRLILYCLTRRMPCSHGRSC